MGANNFTEKLTQNGKICTRAVTHVYYYYKCTDYSDASQSCRGTLHIRFKTNTNVFDCVTRLRIVFSIVISFYTSSCVPGLYKLPTNVFSDHCRRTLTGSVRCMYCICIVCSQATFCEQYCNIATICEHKNLSCVT